MRTAPPVLTDSTDRTDPSEPSPWRASLYEIIFGANTPAGKAFDILLIFCILASIAVVMLDSIQAVRIRYDSWLTVAEWTFTILFTIEYILRLICVQKPLHYARSFFGLVDFLSTIPTYISLLVPGGHYFLVIRTLRLLRVFRILKLVPYSNEARHLMRALKNSGRKLAVFLFAVLVLVVMLGSLMYVIEGQKNGFTSIPRSVYWAIVTLTTVGYGDISPQTPLGQTLAAVIMILGYSIIAVPTGIVGVELAKGHPKTPTGTKKCNNCNATDHDDDALYCKHCGKGLGVSQ